MRGTPLERFFAKIKKTESCWLWRGGRTGFYGCFWTGSVVALAHRFAYAALVESFPAELDILHHCDNPLCVRPDHLFKGTHQDNMQDAASKGRLAQQNKTHCPQGHAYTKENTRMSKLGGRYCLTCKRIRSFERRNGVMDTRAKTRLIYANFDLIED